MRYSILILPATALFILSASAAPKKLFIESREKGHRNITLEVTKAILKQCPNTIRITENKNAAEFSLAPASKSTVLYRADGEVEHIFDARWTVSGLAREVCAYFGGK